MTRSNGPELVLAAVTLSGEPERTLELLSIYPNQYINFWIHEGGRPTCEASLPADQLARLRAYLNTLDLPPVGPVWKNEVVTDVKRLLDIAANETHADEADAFLEFVREFRAWSRKNTHV